MKARLNRLLLVIPITIFFVAINILICSATSTVVLLGLLERGVNGYVSLVTAIVTAFGVYAYMHFFNKIRGFLNNSGDNND